MASSSVDASSFTKFASALRTNAPTLQTKIKGALASTAESVAGKARSNASYSTLIPGSIKVVGTGTTVEVTAGGASAPDAVPIENKGKGYVRHPTFVARADLPGPPGSWTSKHSHKAFFAPAVAESLPTLLDEATTAVDETLDQIVIDA
jgi:hypothetical protein